MAATALVQLSQSAVTAISSSRQDFFDKSSFRSSSLALRSPRRVQGSTTALRHSSGVARSSLKEMITGKHEEKAKETLEFYVHEIRSADPEDKTATLKVAALPANTKPFQWGSTFVFDNELREGVGADSTLIGHERGWGVVTDRNSEDGVHLTSKIAFTEGKFNGSTITCSGHVGGKKSPYELAVIGGTGHFRGARGYVVVDNAPNDGPRFIFLWKISLL